MPWPSGTALCPHVLVSVLILLPLSHPLHRHTQTHTRKHREIQKDGAGAQKQLVSVFPSHYLFECLNVCH